MNAFLLGIAVFAIVLLVFLRARAARLMLPESRSAFGLDETVARLTDAAKAGDDSDLQTSQDEVSADRGIRLCLWHSSQCLVGRSTAFSR